MGYYTDFTVTQSGTYIPEDEIAEQLTLISGYEWNKTLFKDSIKWYNFRIDMVALSKLYPDTVLILDGAGEEKDDIWRIYYKNGKSQDANSIRTYDEFDETKLI